MRHQPVLLACLVLALTGLSPALGARQESACPYCGPINAFSNPRNAGSNLDVLTTTLACPGSTWSASVDLSATGYSSALVIGFKSPAQIALGGGQVLLVDVSDTLYGELLQYAPRPGPQASFSTPLPQSFQLCGFTFSAQAVLFGGTPGFALSNAHDVRIANVP